MAASRDNDINRRKPARVQLDPSLVAENSKPDQTGEVFNIWYSKWTGGENNGKRLHTHAKHRCNVKLDSGYTKADKYIGEGEINRSKHFCLYFARGYCCNGKNCQYLHRIPTAKDIFPTTVDCFGREKFSDYRDDMTGVGSFETINKTLFVSNISNVNSSSESELKSSFGEFGEVTNVKVLPNRNAAFVSFKLESQAQFAKEAMECQSLNVDNKSETLSIRWSKTAQNENSIESHETTELSMEAARQLLESLRQHNLNKRQKTNNEANTKKVKIHMLNDVESSEENVGLDMEAIRKLGQLRRSKNIVAVNLVSGYSSDENSE